MLTKLPGRPVHRAGAQNALCQSFGLTGVELEHLSAQDLALLKTKPAARQNLPQKLLSVGIEA